MFTVVLSITAKILEGKIANNNITVGKVGLLYLLRDCTTHRNDNEYHIMI